MKLQYFDAKAILRVGVSRKIRIRFQLIYTIFSEKSIETNLIEIIVFKIDTN